MSSGITGVLRASVLNGSKGNSKKTTMQLLPKLSMGLLAAGDARSRGRLEGLVMISAVNTVGVTISKPYVSSDFNNTNDSNLFQVFNFETFSSGATNYLLPWLALTSQLPFEMGNYAVASNTMAFCYAVGSPMIVTYSLMVTILNQYWLRKKFSFLEDPDRPLSATSKNARIFLQEIQQVPLRLSQEDGSLASLVVLPENTQWWEKLKTSIRLTRRGVTLSLVAQMLVAVSCFALTVVAAFLSGIGNVTQALALSSGSLWIWLVSAVQILPSKLKN